MKRTAILLSIGLILLSVSCDKQSMEQAAGLRTDITFKVKSAAPLGDIPETRSCYPSYLQDEITDFTIFVFDSNGNSVSANYYPGDVNMSGRALFVNESLHTTLEDYFDVYIIANLGDLSADSELCSAGVPAISKLESFTYDFSGTYQEFHTRGFPMAGYYDDYRPVTDSRTLYADKLVTQYDIRFVKSAQNHNTYTITGGQLCNVAGKCTPFHSFKANSASDINYNGDAFSYSDISALNSGNSASLFVLENEQGEVFPSSVTSSSLRKMESLPPGSIYNNTCTYAEFYVTVQTPTATYDNVTYRYFFGDGLRDCDIHRNMVYTLTMNFDNVYVEDDGWRIEPGSPVIDSDALVLSRNQLSIIKGMSNSFTITHKPDVEYNMTYSLSDAQTYGLNITKSTSGNVDTYTISTDYTTSSSGSTIAKVDYADIPVTFTTVDGLLSKEFNIRINKNPLLVEFAFPDCLGSVDVSQTVDWPVGTTFETTVTGILYGENQYCSNRLFGNYTCDIWQAFLDVYSASNVLETGDASSADFQTLDMCTEQIQTAAHELNRSHPVDHHYAVGSTEVHFTTVGHAYMRVYYAVRINGSVATVPVRIITRGGSSGTGGSTYRVDEDGSSTEMTVRPQRAPAWYYDQAVTDNGSADSYSGGYENNYDEYPVSLNSYVTITNGVTRKYIKGNLQTLNVEGGSVDSYNPAMGMELIYGIPDYVSY